MSSNVSGVDISENNLRNRGTVLDILLVDRTTRRNIIWSTDSYKKYGKEYVANKQIRRDLITGTNGNLIQPRAAKPREEQIARTKDKAEVFTPLKIVRKINLALDWASENYPTTEDNWLRYVRELRLEITCGEAPFIAGRYNPTANTGITIKPGNRVGFLDRKLQVVSEFTKNKKDWLTYAEVALKATYGYEFQGDNLLIARENILQTLDDFYEDFCTNRLKLKNRQKLSNAQLEHFAEIISWNVWQMDGIKYVVPLSCKNITIVTPGLPLLGEQDIIERDLCPGCKSYQIHLHNGRYAKIMDWSTNKPIKFISLLQKVTK